MTGIKITDADREWVQKIHSDNPEVKSYGFYVCYYYPKTVHDYTFGRPYSNEWGPVLTDKQVEDVVKARNFLRKLSPLKKAYRDVSPTSEHIRCLYARLHSPPISAGCFVLAALELKIPIYRYNYHHSVAIGVSVREYNSMLKLEHTLRHMFND